LATETAVSARVAERLLIRARQAGGTTDDPEPGWSRITSGPEEILAVFKPLKLKSGFMLAGYRFREGGNGNGFLYAVPKGTVLPAPEECPVDTTQFLSPPVPPTALEDVMDAIEGDGSPLSYLCASLLERELAEYGAMWHGCSWSTHELVTQDPFAIGGCLRPKSGDADQMETQRDIENWRWLKSKPSRWEPRVKIADDNVTVTFHTHSALGREAIYRHIDRYKPGTYRSKTRRIVIAEGPGGYIF
jgi:hypothetical protein